MLQERMRQYMNSSTAPIFAIEKAYIEKHQLLPVEMNAKEAESERFEEAYIERCDKETEELLTVEDASFLNQPLSYLKDHSKEFIYIESHWFNLAGADAVSLEADDVFGTYDVMLGLKLQKKFGNSIKKYLSSNLSGGEPKFDLLFSQDDGLWDLNFALNYSEDFKEDITLNEAFNLIYRFLFNLAAEIEEQEIL